MAEKEKEPMEATGKAKEKGGKDDDKDESEPEDPLAHVAVAAVVEEIAAELKRSRSEAEGVKLTLERHWVRTMADYHACVEAGTELPELPALMRVKLSERVAKLKNVHEDVGPRLEEIAEESQEDREQKRVISELAHCYEAGEKHKVVVKVFINKLENLSTADSTLDFDIGVQCWFIDEKQVGHAEGEVSDKLYSCAF
jgi:hypothetical protein